MFEIVYLRKNANPDTDWCVLVKTYVKVGFARRKMYSMLLSGQYQAVILRDTVKQPDRDELIRRMNDHIDSDYYRRSCNHG